MNISTPFSGARRFFFGIPAGAAFLAIVLFASLTPSTAHAQRFAGRGFGRGFGGGLGWGLGFGLGSALVYDSAYGYGYPGVVYTSAPPTVYYVPQPQTVVVNSAPATVATPAPVAAPAPAVAAPAGSTPGTMSRIVYDANGKPLGVLILNTDGSQQFVPLAK